MGGAGLPPSQATAGQAVPANPVIGSHLMRYPGKKDYRKGLFLLAMFCSETMTPARRPAPPG